VLLLGACGVFCERVLRCGALGADGVFFADCLRLMTSADRKDLVPTQEKLEWVTPKISLLEAEDTEGTRKVYEFYEDRVVGPS